MIEQFNGKYRFLSNFHYVRIQYEGLAYPTTEHAFQATKFLDPRIRQYIASLATPSAAKHTGRLSGIVEVAPGLSFDFQLRTEWDEIKDSVMMAISTEKYKSPTLRELLTATYPHKLVEGNYWHDNYWGSCNCPRCGNKGKNKLGITLMDLRRTIIQERSMYETYPVLFDESVVQPILPSAYRVEDIGRW